MWDAGRRNFGALVSQSADNENTKGCKFQRDLEDMIKTGNRFDAAIQKVEEKHRSGRELTDEEIASSADDCKAILDIIKNGQKKAGALRPWFKIVD